MLPRSSVIRKINDLVKRARLVKVHAHIVAHLRAQMPAMFGGGIPNGLCFALFTLSHFPQVAKSKRRFATEAKKEELLNTLPEVFKQVTVTISSNFNWDFAN